MPRTTPRKRCWLGWPPPVTPCRYIPSGCVRWLARRIVDLSSPFQGPRCVGSPRSLCRRGLKLAECCRNDAYIISFLECRVFLSIVRRIILSRGPLKERFLLNGLVETFRCGSFFPVATTGQIDGRTFLRASLIILVSFCRILYPFISLKVLSRNSADNSASLVERFIFPLHVSGDGRELASCFEMLALVLQLVK